MSRRNTPYRSNLESIFSQLDSRREALLQASEQAAQRSIMSSIQLIDAYSRNTELVSQQKAVAANAAAAVSVADQFVPHFGPSPPQAHLRPLYREDAHAPPPPQYSPAQAPPADPDLTSPASRQASSRPGPRSSVRHARKRRMEQLVPKDVLEGISARVHKARNAFGEEAVKDVFKGLSRVLETTREDVELFGLQLKEEDGSVFGGELDGDVPVFALSYRQSGAKGWFKFDGEQWEVFGNVVEDLRKCGVKKIHVWLDQCLWLRGGGRDSWAHVGALPYLLWPVISLGMKGKGWLRSVESEERMWVFVEEVCALWGMGIVFGREMRGGDGTWRKAMSFQRRKELDPETGMWVLLLNIFHGAVDCLLAGRIEDVNELKEMARANVLLDVDGVYVGAGWRMLMGGARPRGAASAITGMALPIYRRRFGGEDVYLDASCTVVVDEWDGIMEWLSGDEGVLNVDGGRFDLRVLESGMKKANVRTEDGMEFNLLQIGGERKAVWLLVEMEAVGQSFGIGKVKSTKILTGPGSCQLMDAIDGGHIETVRGTLEFELGRNLTVSQAVWVREDIEWV